MAADDAARADADDDDLERLSRDALDERADAAEAIDLPAAGELEPPQMRSTTAAIACPKPIHIVAIP